MYFDAANVIKKKIVLGINPQENNNKLDIAYGIDKNFFSGCIISITSILLFNSNLNFSFHIFANYIDDSLERKLNELVNKYNVNITIYLIDDMYLSNLPTTQNWSIATYFRFIIADYFFSKINKILYLDADIFCKGSIKELFFLQFEDNIAYVVKEKNNIWWKKCATRLNEKKLEFGYFNAGFLLIDLNKWKEFEVNNKALELLSNPSSRSKFTHLDQDVLNLILLDNIKYLDRKYNKQININYELKYKTTINNNELAISDEMILIHYIGPTKPWHSWAKDYKYTEFFLNAKFYSPCKTEPLLEPCNSQQLRYCAKHKMHQKKFFSSLFFYLKYFVRKIKDRITY
ncbi:glycosyltransferase [Gilliamella apicola]|uniref:glycosyltransferase n=1 Tax=Gilliamella apicola TaxID=1196095 RepID=UPI00080F524D|nr:glycosyltransferase [Gilliamella apis]OCF95118.1 hypothetical protein A9G16_00340 [Gilliamella apis]